VNAPAVPHAAQSVYDPGAPVVEYLARSLSAFYALLGALLLERFRPLARFLAAAIVLMSIVFTGVDLAAGMPWWWTVFEGPPGIALGAWMFYLARPAQRAGGLP
jgi:ABC-type multidrug transport system permease subunit